MGFKEMHLLNYIHNDIKINNIGNSKTNKFLPKIFDYGLSCKVNEINLGGTFNY